MKYEDPKSYKLKDMANVKVFANKQKDKQTDKQAKNYMPQIYRCRGIKMWTVEIRYQTAHSVQSDLDLHCSQKILVSPSGRRELTLGDCVLHKFQWECKQNLANNNIKGLYRRTPLMSGN